MSTVALTGLGVAVLSLRLSVFAATASSLSRHAEGSAPASYGIIHGNTARGREIAQSKCALCHGSDGNGAIAQIPKLAGQNPEYLYEQLQAFRSGSRRSAAMAAIAAGLSPADPADVATYYASLSVKPDPIAHGSLAAKGESIFFSGNGWMMTRCVMCHDGSSDTMMGGGMMGSRMMGMTGGVVNLNGQHAVYIINQLDHFANGERKSAVMDPIAQSLSEAERKGVATYLSGLR